MKNVCALCDPKKRNDSREKNRWFRFARQIYQHVRKPVFRPFLPLPDVRTSFYPSRRPDAGKRPIFRTSEQTPERNVREKLPRPVPIHAGTEKNSSSFPAVSSVYRPFFLDQNTRFPGLAAAPQHRPPVRTEPFPETEKTVGFCVHAHILPTVRKKVFL